jgi:hypothetical protein
MKALSIRQPWAWAIIHAGKDVENRRWSTNYRGQFLVHAAKGMTRGEYEDAAEDIEMITGISPPFFEDLERGGIIGSVELIDCVTDSSSPWFGGHYGFLLHRPLIVPFWPVKGMLGFFDVDMPA